jgi:hypothetical protein
MHSVRGENGWKKKTYLRAVGKWKGRHGVLCFLFLFLAVAWGDPAQASRVKDIAKLTGVRPNQLFGYGLVMGLNGSGDKKGTEFTIQSLTNMLTKMGINVDPNQVKVKNVAAVMVTAELPAFARPGMRLDALVSSIGDAKSLQGGTLLLTQLQGVDGEVYALAQGPVSIGGIFGWCRRCPGSDEPPNCRNHPRGRPRGKRAASLPWPDKSSGVRASGTGLHNGRKPGPSRQPRDRVRPWHPPLTPEPFRGNPG